MKLNELIELVEQEFDIKLIKQENSTKWVWEDRKKLRKKLNGVVLDENYVGELAVHLYPNEKGVQVVIDLNAVNERSKEEVEEFIDYIYENFLWNKEF